MLEVPSSPDLYPLNVLREEHTLHFGVRSIANQWQECLQAKPHTLIHPRLLPSPGNVAVVLGLAEGQHWTHQGERVAQCGEGSLDLEGGPNPDMLKEAPDLFERAEEGLQGDLVRLKLAWRLRTLEEEERDAWARVGVIVHGPMERIHLAPGAVLRDATLNTDGGDIVIGPDAEVMEGCRIRAPFALGEGSTLRMGTLIYGPTTVGSHCKVGGELSNVVIHDFSNKAHSGFLGNSVLGSWCNLGAETTCSNLKNTYGEIAEWSESVGALQGRGRKFCGLLMGDHSKSAIHTAFNTATVIGAMCNVFGASMPPKHLPSFSWGTEGDVHDVERGLATARKVMARRDVVMTPEEDSRIRAAFAERVGAD